MLQRPVIDCSGVAVSRGGATVLGPLDWRVMPGERWVVIGPNGAGKTTLLDVVSARAHPTRGAVELLGEQLGLVDVFALRPRIGVVSAAGIDPGERVRDAVLTAAYGGTARWREAYEGQDLERAARLLQRFGVADLAQRPIGTLSDGERKRALIARALMPDPELLVLDEPAAGLDLGSRELLVRMLAELALDPLAPAVVMVTHHVEEVPVGFTHAMLLRGGSSVASGPLSQVLTGRGLTRAFGTPITVGRFGGRYFAVSATAMTASDDGQ